MIPSGNMSCDALLKHVSSSAFNSSVYFRPKYKTARDRNPEESRVISLLSVLRISIPPVKCCCGAKSELQPHATIMQSTDKEKGKNETKKSTNVHADEENANNLPEKNAKNPQEMPVEDKRKDGSSNEAGTEEAGGQRKKSVRISDAA